MADEREKKRKKSHASGEPAPAPARDTQDMTAGELLRHTREQKGMELEEVSSAIHVRVAQLRAIEEGHIESLPGMTYALGFVKSYASYLKLDPTSVAIKFKAEHSVAPAKPDLKFPEPMAEHKMPDLFMIGAGVVAVAVLLGAWFFFSGGEEKTASTVASNIPAPPPEIAPLTANVGTAPTEASGAGTTPIPTTTGAAETVVAATAAAPAAAPAAAATAAATPAAVPAAAKTAATITPSTAEATAAPAKADKTQTAKAETPMMMPTEEHAPSPESQPRAQQNETINIRPGRGRIVLHAIQSTWVQVTDGEGNIVLKRVLRPGERYFVPDETGLQMITSNAGGLTVYVDGRDTGTLGQSGQIVRGVPLNPDALKRNGGSSAPQYRSSHPLVHD